jgi:hypothetical protein
MQTDAPIEGELNPNHVVTQSMREQWHKIAALLLLKLGGEASITLRDVANMGKKQRSNIVIQEKNEGLKLRLVSDTEAARLAREEGGLPI